VLDVSSIEQTEFTFETVDMDGIEWCCFSWRWRDF